MVRKIKDTERIVVPYGTNKKIAEALGFSPDIICKTLKGLKVASDENFFLIRKQAIDIYGGRVLR